MFGVAIEAVFCLGRYFLGVSIYVTKVKDMINLDYIINYYVAIVAFAVGFSVSQYIEKGSLPSVSLVIVLLGSGVAIFNGLNTGVRNDIAEDRVGPITAWALAAGGCGIGWSVGQAIWGSSS